MVNTALGASMYGRVSQISLLTSVRRGHEPAKQICSQYLQPLARNVNLNFVTLGLERACTIFFDSSYYLVPKAICLAW